MGESKTRRPPPPAEEPAPDREERSEGLRPLGTTRCPYCHEEADRDTSVACQGCLARHHAACWEEQGGCAACGGDRALRPEPKPITDDRVEALLRRGGHSREEIEAYFSGRAVCTHAKCSRTAASEGGLCPEHARAARRSAAIGLLVVAGLTAAAALTFVLTGLATQTEALLVYVLVYGGLSVALGGPGLLLWRSARRPPEGD